MNGNNFNHEKKSLKKYCPMLVGMGLFIILGLVERIIGEPIKERVEFIRKCIVFIIFFVTFISFSISIYKEFKELFGKRTNVSTF